MEIVIIAHVLISERKCSHKMNLKNNDIAVLKSGIPARENTLLKQNTGSGYENTCHSTISRVARVALQGCENKVIWAILGVEAPT